MRIAVVSEIGRRVGGAESYLARVLPALATRGHTVAFMHESEGPPDRAAVAPAHIESWCVDALGEAAALERLRAWRPDVTYVHGVRSLTLNAVILGIAPSVYFAHSHSGMCIAGTKAFTSPDRVPCSRPFDAGCLLHYYPRRCGGLSPLTLARSYTRERQRRESFAAYQAVAVGSRYMGAEISRYLPPDARIHVVPLFVEPPPSLGVAVPARSDADACRILFAGRMDAQKGGRLLLDAAGLVAEQLARPVALTLAGDGPERDDLRTRAEALAADAGGRIRATFPGWLDRRALDDALASADVFALPSLAPESFGLAGLEATAHGTPCVAFGFGGVTEWLVDGVNGHVAASQPPDAAAFARALVATVADLAHHATLRAGAARVAATFTLARHLDGLEHAFTTVVGAPPLAPA